MTSISSPRHSIQKKGKLCSAKLNEEKYINLNKLILSLNMYEWNEGKIWNKKMLVGKTGGKIKTEKPNQERIL